jgi:hypothetical protein
MQWKVWRRTYNTNLRRKKITKKFQKFLRIDYKKSDLIYILTLPIGRQLREGCTNYAKDDTNLHGLTIGLLRQFTFQSRRSRHSPIFCFACVQPRTAWNELGLYYQDCSHGCSGSSMHAGILAAIGCQLKSYGFTLDWNGKTPASI